MDSNDLRLEIRNTKVLGARRTLPSVFDNELQAAYNASTLSEVDESVKRAAFRLSRLGVFETVDMQLGVAEGGEPYEVDLTITVREKNWYTASVQANTHTNAKKGEMDLRPEAEGTLTNIFGRAEKITVAAITDSHLDSAGTYMARLLMPHVWNTPLTGTFEAKWEKTDMTRHTSYTELAQGFCASLRAPGSGHTFDYKFIYRDVTPQRHRSVPYAMDASKAVIAEARPSLKSSIGYSYVKDGRDNPFSPERGNLFKGAMEAAGLFGGDVGFCKAELEAQTHHPLVELPYGPLTWSGIASVGAIKAFNQSTTTHIIDRFFMGGPLELRGFQVFGVGPRAPKETVGSNLLTNVPPSAGDALGGDLRYTMSTALSWPVPIPALARHGVRGMSYINAGNITNWNAPVSGLAKDTRVSAGGGILWNFIGMARLEISFSKVLRANSHDKLRAWQFGLGLQFY
ncbi:unnamed protein product [Chrysoparadoxa australica]